MSALRRTSVTLHLWVGVALSLVLVVISVTGSALVFRHEIDRALNPDLLQVPPAEQAAPLSAVVAAIETESGGTPRLLRLPRTPDAPIEAWLKDDLHAYVDPYSAAVLGLRSGEEGTMNTLFALHAELLGGTPGAVIVGVIGLLTLLLALTGLVLWWPPVPSVKRVWQRLVIATTRGRWRFNYDLHRAGGLYTSGFLVLVAATGAALVFYAETGALLNAATGSRAPEPPPVASAGALGPDVLDAALGTARRVLPDGEATFVTLPQSPGQPLAIRFRVPGEWHPNGRSYVYLDPASGGVLRTDDARAVALGPRLLYAAYPLHIGAFGGSLSWAVRLLYVLLGLSPAVLSVTGALIWYRRWRKQSRRISRSRQ